MLELFKKKRSNQPQTWVFHPDYTTPHRRIVKRDGTTEQYIRSKLIGSIQKACMDATGFIGEAELTARKVSEEVELWLVYKYEVTSLDIQRIAVKALRKYNPQAAFEYAPYKENKIKRDDYGIARL